MVFKIMGPLFDQIVADYNVREQAFLVAVYISTESEGCKVGRWYRNTTNTGQTLQLDGSSYSGSRSIFLADLAPASPEPTHSSC